MKEIDCEILIVGSGLTGLVAAHSLSSLGYKIIVVDQKKILSGEKNNLKDTRTTAISEGSKKFLQEINLWREIENYAEPIKRIEVIDRVITNKINFFNYDKKNNLGYIVKNTKFTNFLKKKLVKKKNVSFLDNTKILSIETKENRVKSVFKNILILSNLLVAADGKRSSVRNILQTPVFTKKYYESALVINFLHTKDHKNTAYEIFYNTGPLAILPMQSKHTLYQSSLVWSYNKNYLMRLCESNDMTVKKLLEERIGPIVGDIKKIITKQMFPLSAHLNRSFFEKRVVYAGDSAHSIHPIAGQGWNLGLRDIKNLHNLSIYSKNLGLEIGTNNFCKEYNDLCYYDAYQLYQITDKLNLIFKKDSLILKNIRSVGLNIIQKNNKLKKRITEFAMGF